MVAAVVAGAPHAFLYTRVCTAAAVRALLLVSETRTRQSDAR